MIPFKNMQVLSNLEQNKMVLRKNQEKYGKYSIVLTKKLL